LGSDTILYLPPMGTSLPVRQPRFVRSKNDFANLFKWSMPSPPTVRVNRKAADRVASGHPWIFTSDVIDRGSAQAGDAVRVVDLKGRLLGTAHFSSTSQISLRLLSKHVEPIHENFL